ncbi:enoyl-CoA hydratase/isomerase family protein [Halalkalibacter okhensis]|uniref:Enoyl-CoA hydratase n=1 Tax=Halalkalibacter okhensis TaxID=333138 RepID=A0A0B0I8G7_9BACI|nr:enoyl-CoA hydratase/isomerase family protein [Halalkalibacter okhensis]KHF38783.1 enoyl-CoA hydratase [Halalkalibacter okhensis]
MSSSIVLYKVENETATITLHRPEVKNALSKEMLDEMFLCFLKANDDKEVKVIVLEGSGDAFSAGADIKSIPLEDMQAFDYGTYLDETYNRLIRQIVSTPKPVVAYVNGLAVGAGLSIALACDYRVASANATFGLGFLKIGLVPDAGASYFLPRLVGLSKSMEFALGQMVSADEALQMNLITQMEQLDPLVSQLRNVPPTAYQLMKKNFLHGLDHHLEDVLQMEVDAQRQAGKTKEHQAAIMRFLKR